MAEEEEEMVEEGNDESEEAPEPAGLTPEEKAERAAVKKAKQEAREAKEQVEDYPYSPVVTLTLTILKALSQLLPMLEKKGLKCVTLSELYLKSNPQRISRKATVT